MEMRLLRGDEMALFYTRDLDSAFPAAELKPLRNIEKSWAEGPGGRGLHLGVCPRLGAL